MLEIYNEMIRDLLGKDPNAALEVKESAEKGVWVKGLTRYTAQNAKSMQRILKIGNQNRKVGATDMNKESSRSHSIFQITIESGEKNMDGHIRVGKLNMVDLAGSERQEKTKAEGDRLREGIKINLSLSALGNVISHLVDGNKHIPYRYSKLTRLLQDSLGGNTKTVMVANCSPADYNHDETGSTLRYADRAKRIKNKPKINEDPKDAMLRQYQEEILKLKKLLEAKGLEIERGIQLQELPASENSIAIATQPQAMSSDGTVQSQQQPQVVYVDRIPDEKLKEMMQSMELEKQQLVETMTSKSEEEKRAILEEKQRMEQERVNIEQELQRRHEELEKQKKEKEAMEKKLQEMAAHVVKGKTVIEAKNKEHVAEIEKQKMQLEKQQEEQLRLRRELQEKEEEKFTFEKQYANLQEEVDVKTKKLKKLWNKYQGTKREVEELQREFQVERDEYLVSIRQMERELKLRQKIIDHFIPPEEVAKVTRCAMWDEETEEWKIRHLFLAGNNQHTARRPHSSTANRPTSQYAKSMSSANNNPRFKADNIISIDLEMPERTTQDYDPYKSLLEAEEMIAEKENAQQNQAQQAVYYSYGTTSSMPKKKRPQSSKQRPKSAKSTAKSIDMTAVKAAPTSNNEAAAYPSARGLVKTDKRFV